MELKKAPKADLENKKGLFTLIGLTLALLSIIGAFSWSQKEIEFEVIEQEEVIIENEVVEITREEPPKVLKPKVAPPVVTTMIEVVKNEIELETDANMFDVDMTEDTKVSINFGYDEGGEDEVAEEVPVLIAEKMPSFNGGDTNTFRAWVQSKLVYPSIAEENNISGRVVCKFVVGSNGVIKTIEILSSPDKSLSDEVVRIIKMSPKWTPGEQRGKSVPVIIIIPIMFTFG